MKLLLIAYIIIINLIGLFLMGIDKRRARRRGWRVSERTPFTVALLCGSVGILIGMYLFRHKTRHLSFVMGIPAILVAQLLLLSFLFTWNSHHMSSPSQAVQYELNLISELDSDTIHSYVSYENLMNSYLVSGQIGEETSEAVDLFFEKFHYDVLNETIQEDQATVRVSIRNIDMQALAVDLCTVILKESVKIFPDSTTFTTSDYYRLLRDTLASGSYDMVKTTAEFHLKKDESGWVILVDNTLEDELVSGFISYMNDPHILSASTVLSIHLDALKELDSTQWMEYLAIEDIFATYNTDYYQLIDHEYVTQLAEYFDYEILRCTESETEASAVVRIHSVDMTSVLENYKEHLLTYAATTKSIRDDDTTFSNETARLLLQALQNNQEKSAIDVNLTLTNNGSAWELYFDEDFTDALMGGMSTAIDSFNAVAQESNSFIVRQGQ